MNERIKQLAVEADFMLCEDDHFYSEGQSQKITKQLQKFAELIVKECIDKIENEAAQYAEPVWAFELVNDIKEHFGVEE
jgi:hypothetical protein